MMKVGVIGCGNIADLYFKNSSDHFNNFEIIACADIKEEASKLYADKYQIKQMSIDDLLSSGEIELVINLTIPNAHFEVSASILKAKKHSYSEKPLSIEFEDGQKLLNLAKEQKVYVGCAPDTFLGAGGQLARKLVDENKIGKISLGSIAMAVPGHEIWHPNPDFYYQYGGGPILDMGPYYFSSLVNLLGPAVSVESKIRNVYEERVIGSGDRQGEVIKVETPTSIISHIEFKSGALIDAFFSFDVWKHNKNHIELYGDLGSLNVPDPNMFGGEILGCFNKGGDWKIFETKEMILGKYNVLNFSGKSNEVPTNANYRGIGVSEMIDAIHNNRHHRCSGEFSLHVLDIMDSILKSGKENKKLKLRSECSQPKFFSEDDIKPLISNL